MTVDARQSPEAATAAAAAALAGTDTTTTNPPQAPAAPDTDVVLPGGLFDPLHDVASTHAEVRELNGEDEEAVLRVQGNLAKTLETILTRGVVAVGDKKADSKVLDMLLAADRDALLIAIRQVTFGDEIDLEGVQCPHCNEKQNVQILCSRDIPVERLDSPADRWFDTTLSTGRTVGCSLPDGATQRALANSEDKTLGVLNTLMLTHCIRNIDGSPILGADTVKRLKWREREEILKEINKRNPGPRLGEVKRPCSACAEDILLPLSLVDLFRL